MARIPAEIAAGSVGQASISRANSGSICDSRAEKWTNAFSGVALTSLSGSGLGEGVSGLSIRWLRVRVVPLCQKSGGYTAKASPIRNSAVMFYVHPNSHRDKSMEIV
jgi:hypothetical protein